MKALLFDVDGTLAETEDLHRRSFNAAFAECGIGWHWDREVNRELLAVSGGIERMRFYMERFSGAEPLAMDRLAELHRAKRRHYSEMLASGALQLRPGVRDLLEAARGRRLACAVVTAASAASFNALAQACLPRDLREVFEVVVTGDDVARKKPDPQGYLLALSKLGLAPGDAIVFEDSPVGCAAAQAAGIRVVVTPTEDGPDAGEIDGALVLPSLERQHWPRFGFPPVT